MRISAQRMADENRVVARGIQFPVGFVSQRDLRQLAAHLQRQRLGQAGQPHMPQRLGMPYGIAALKRILRHAG